MESMIFTGMHHKTMLKFVNYDQKTNIEIQSNLRGHSKKTTNAN